MAEILVGDGTPALVELMAADEPVGREYAIGAWRSHQAGRVRFLVATSDGHPVGSCEVTTQDRPRVCNLAVRQDHRGRGIGSLLIAHAEQIAADRGELAIWVGTDNAAAHRLYDRLGYRSTGRSNTTTYEYVDDDGIRRVATETDVELLKRWPRRG